MICSSSPTNFMCLSSALPVSHSCTSYSPLSTFPYSEDHRTTPEFRYLRRCFIPIHPFLSETTYLLSDVYGQFETIDSRLIALAHGPLGSELVDRDANKSSATRIMLDRKRGNELSESELEHFDRKHIASSLQGRITLSEGQCIHEHIMRIGGLRDTYTQNLLISMYGKLGAQEEARSVFDKIKQRDVVSWNSVIMGYVKRENLQEAMELFRQMPQQGVKPNKITFLGMLNVITSSSALAEAKEIHKHIIDLDLESDGDVGCSLINTYSKCGALEDAFSVFTKLRRDDSDSWTAMMTAYFHLGKSKEALTLFQEMEQRGINPTKVTFSAIIGAITKPPPEPQWKAFRKHAGNNKLESVIEGNSLIVGRQIHSLIIKNGLERDRFLGNLLISMYRKWDALNDACLVFNKMCKKKIISWNSIIATFIQCGYENMALNLFQKMQEHKVKPNEITFASILSTFATPAALRDAIAMHAIIIDTGLESDLIIGNALIDMYNKCASPQAARLVFNKMHKHDVVSWSTMIAGYSHHGHCKKAIKMFQGMMKQGLKPNRVTYIYILEAHAKTQFLEGGRTIHAWVVNDGIESDTGIENALISMYVKCGSLEDAHLIFDTMHNSTVVSWTAMMYAYFEHGHADEVLQLFQEMQQQIKEPNEMTFVCVLHACATLGAFAECKKLHGLIIEAGFDCNADIRNALISMYGKCGAVDDAYAVFENSCQADVVSWNTMMAVYAQHGHANQALDLFVHMRQQGVQPNRATVLCILSVCASPTTLVECELIHGCIISLGLETDVAIGNALIDMYSNCGALRQAYFLFEKMRKEQVATWNAIITAFSWYGRVKDALDFFLEMRHQGIKLDKVTFIELLHSCARTAAKDEAKVVHASIVDAELESDVVIGSALVDMYGKLGEVRDARVVFDKIAQPNVLTWTAMIAVYSQHGHGKEAVQLFNEMQEQGLEPDEISFVCLLSACSHAGLVDEGFTFFVSMNEDYGIKPTLQIYTCMIDLFGRAGQLDEAENALHKMPFQPDAAAWMTLLSACTIHGDMERAECATRNLLYLASQNDVERRIFYNSRKLKEFMTEGVPFG